ncbi:response regulator transcription factor [Streptomyces sp. NPDC004232]|uniref:response regulator transcription factor n=1 Tax=Streptomyces sp. NPDC004232 TaxID=3154454 RepID=UPI001D3E467D|nr:response regulator transcription factor [Streptomyces sp. tea 10]
MLNDGHRPHRTDSERFEEWLRLAGLDRLRLAALLAGRTLPGGPDQKADQVGLITTALVWLLHECEGAPPPMVLDVVVEYTGVVHEQAQHTARRATELADLTTALLVGRETVREAEPLVGSSPDLSIPSEALDLTSREYEILRLIGDALTNRQIASSLGISEKTVKNHITSLFAKLGVSDRTKALVVGLRDGLLAVQTG